MANASPGGGGFSFNSAAAPAPDGSETRTSIPQTNFWQYAEQLFGTNLPGDTGLLGNAMPGISNTPQPMHWNASHGWWAAEGIPIIPKNKFGDDQPYPLVRVTARDASGTLLADTLVTAPVSAEMNCITCHASDTQAAAEPATGWSDNPDPIRDYRLNILKLHDTRHFGNPIYTAALAQVGYSAQGQHDSVVSQAKPILCANCHGSNALGTSGAADVDLDADGLPDLIERAFGLSVSRVSRGSAPEIALHEVAPGQRVLQAVYNPKLIPPDLAIIFEVSADLKDWSETSPALTTSTDAAGNTVNRVEIGSQSHLFLRYRVTRR